MGVAQCLLSTPVTFLSLNNEPDGLRFCRFVLSACRALKEPKPALVRAAVDKLGRAVFQGLMNEVTRHSGLQLLGETVELVTMKVLLTAGRCRRALWWSDDCGWKTTADSRRCAVEHLEGSCSTRSVQAHYAPRQIS